MPVLLAGNMCDARLWHGANWALSKSLDARGYHECFDADLTLDVTIAAMAARALEQSLKAAGGKLLLIGFSMGAIAAVQMAAIAPERIAGLVLAGYNATADLPERAALRPAQQAEVRAGGLERVLVEELKPNYLAAQNRSDAALLSLLCDMGLGLGKDVFLRQSEALRLRDDQRGIIAALNVPVLYLCGAEDALCPPSWHKSWASVTPDARFEQITGAGHMLPLEAPHAMTAAIENWLNHN